MGEILSKKETTEERFVDFLTDFEIEFVSLVDHGANRAPFKIVRSDNQVERAVWSTAYVNSLPNSSFAVIETGYKDGDSPKTARHLPFKDAGGKVDLPHLRNALARANQIKSVLHNDSDAELRARAQRKLAPYAKKHLNKKGEERMLDVVQSVLLPKNAEIDAMRSKIGWLHEIDESVKEQFEFYSKYNCTDVDKFDQLSLRIERMDDGALALVGNLFEPDESAIVYRSQMDKHTGFSSDGYAVTLRDLVSRELSNTVGAVISTLELSEMSIKDKKKAVGAALNAFRTYIEMGLDHASEGLQLRFEKQQDGTAEIKEDGVADMSEETVERVETQEETIDIKSLVFQALEEKLPEAIERALADKLAEKEAKEEVARVEQEAKVVVEMNTQGMDELKDTIKSLEERLAKFEAEDAELPGQSGAASEKVVVTKSAEPPNLWGGVIFSRIARN